MFLPLGFSLEKFFSILQAKASVIIQAAKVVLPGLKTPPKGINPDAEKKYWKEYVNKYSHVWEKYKNEPERAWACCVAIWTNYCLKRRIQPFNPAATMANEETRDTLINRILSAREAQIKLADTLLTRGVRKGIFSKYLKETLESVSENRPGVYTILTKRGIKLEKGVEFGDDAFKNLMALSSFQRKAGVYVRNVRANTDVIIRINPDTEKPELVFKNVITKAMAEIVLEMEPEKGNNDKVKSRLTLNWKYMMKQITG